MAAELCNAYSKGVFAEFLFHQSLFLHLDASLALEWPHYNLAKLHDLCLESFAQRHTLS